MKQDNVSNLTKLGSRETNYQYDSPSIDMLEAFENQYPKREYKTEFIFEEFTSLCPKTHQPDFATIKVEYIADKLCLETKSLKMYFLAYRNEGSFMETITNRILEDIFEVITPRWIKITANFKARGGTLINITAEEGAYC